MDKERHRYRVGDRAALTCRPDFPMTVESHDLDSATVVVIWFDRDSHIQRTSFKESMLTPVPVATAAKK